MFKRFVLLIVFIVSAFTQSPNSDENLTGSLPNGRFWVKYPAERLIYLVGLRDGLNLVVANPQYFPNGKAGVEAYRPQKLTNEDMIAAIDNVYKDRENIRIPVAFVYNFVNEKLKGSLTKTDVDLRIRRMRQLASEY